jgi:hypothetical protein
MDVILHPNREWNLHPTNGARKPVSRNKAPPLLECLAVRKTKKTTTVTRTIWFRDQHHIVAALWTFPSHLTKIPLFGSRVG